MNKHVTQIKEKPVGVVFILIALLPIIVHVLLLTQTVLKNNSIQFGTFDLVMFIILLAYLLALLFTTNRRKLFTRIVLVTFSILFSIIILEYTLRILFPPLPKIPTHKVWDVAPGIIPGVSGKWEYTINKYGVRGPELNLDNMDIKILAIGGSTTACLYISDKLSWPWKLQNNLSSLLKKTVFVGNSGKSGQFTLNHIYLLENYKWAPQYDWIIVLCGINDLGRLLRGDYEVRQKALAAHTFGLGGVGKDLIYYKKLKIWVISKYLFYKYFSQGVITQDPEALWYLEQREIRKKALEINAVDKIPPGINEALADYKSSLKKIINICRARNQNLLMPTQPTMWRNDLPQNLKELLWEYVDQNTAYTVAALNKSMEAFNRALIEVCKQEKTFYIDLASLLPKDDSVFYDDCHFNISGNEAVAIILTNKIVERYKKDLEKKD